MPESKYFSVYRKRPGLGVRGLGKGKRQKIGSREQGTGKR
jgi:hypothetical protein